VFGALSLLATRKIGGDRSPPRECIPEPILHDASQLRLAEAKLAGRQAVFTGQGAAPIKCQQRAFPVKLNTEEPNFQLAHIISWDHARYAAT
ncbi:MAG TPA: hypothetical protein VE734_01465, partial [Terriglobales bacterium]|nr:hypothetical protein [Terriglobales bacterium]